MDAIATFSLVALDTPDPRGLAGFYGLILGWHIDPARSSDDWVELKSPVGATISFQLAPAHTAPDWPGDAHPQQAHLDFDVPDLEAGEAAIMAIGARKADFQPGGESFRVYLDPSGHPFCLVRSGSY